MCIDIQVKPTLLVIEDDHDTRVEIRAAFEEAGYSVISATEGTEGLKLLRTSDPLPCAILLDMMLPIMAGEEFLNTKAQDPRAAKIPVIVFTASKTPIPKMPQVVATFQKPVDIHKLIAVINKHCRKAKKS
jgi:two-component system, chemotaxis family, chemotaxis protein CheY